LTIFCQEKDSLVTHPTKKKHIFLRQFALPSVLIGLGVYGTTNNSFINHDEIREERTEHFSSFTNKADNYLQFTAVPAVFVMDAFGLKAKNNWQQQALLLGKSQLIMVSIVFPLKKYTHILRPDSSDFNSFPSGHTAQAFLAATFFHKEYGRKYPWASAGMFTLATGIGALRILNNRHWISDVLAGAGIGILSVELSYLLQRKRPGKHNKLPVTIIPSYQGNYFSCTALFNLP
jgi:membrane-associated phospholipid phosphatase